MAELKRTLGLAECIFFGVGSILGAGIYTILGKVAGLSGNFIWLAFLIASMCALATAFSYAELSSAFPSAGGEYTYAKKAFGKTTGVILGVIISLNGIISSATVAVGFAGYLSTLLGVGVLVGALGILAVLFGVNAAGIRQSSVVNIVFTIIEVSGLLLIIFVAIPKLGSVNFMEMPSQGSNGIMAAAALAFFSYMGFEEIVKLAEETKNPEKTIPKALFWASGIVIVVYGLVAISTVSVISFAELGKSQSPLADVLAASYGRTGIIIISVIALFATSNTILSNMLGSSRVLLDMSAESKFLKPLSFVSPKRKTPLAALIAVLVISGAFSLIGDIEIIARIATIFIFITFIVVNLSVIILRIREKELTRPYRIPVTFNNIPLIPVFGILLTLILLGYTIYSLF
ncbi:MAG TPA: amino acid permease [Flavobacterium sp.]|jgi:APA family basic amino acid/polyamine antiporter